MSAAEIEDRKCTAMQAVEDLEDMGAIDEIKDLRNMMQEIAENLESMAVCDKEECK